MTRESYPKETEENNWKLMLENNFQKQFEMARKVQHRMKLREIILIEDGLASDPLAP